MGGFASGRPLAFRPRHCGLRGARAAAGAGGRAHGRADVPRRRRRRGILCGPSRRPVLLEGRVNQDRWEILRFLLSEVRISALHQDPNAAGSYFALILVPAFIIALRHRSIWLTLGVIPLVIVAFVFAQSRAAMLAIGVILGLVAILAMFKSRRFVLATSVVVLIAILGLGASVRHPRFARFARTRGRDSAARSRSLAFDMTHDHPAFGVGIGHFRRRLAHYVTDNYPALRRFAPRGQNAHNNFLQILGSWVFSGLARSCGWSCRRHGAGRGNRPPRRTRRSMPARWPPASRPSSSARCSAIRLLIIQVAAAFFFAARPDVSAPPGAARTEPPRPGRDVGRILAVIVLSLPWRILDARASARDDEGLSAVVGTMDDVRTGWPSR